MYGCESWTIKKAERQRHDLVTEQQQLNRELGPQPLYCSRVNCMGKIKFRLTFYCVGVVKIFAVCCHWDINLWTNHSSRICDCTLHFHFSLSCIGEGNGNPLQCSCLENPGTREPGGLPSMGSHRVGHDWNDLAAAAAAACIRDRKLQIFLPHPHSRKSI